MASVARASEQFGDRHIILALSGLGYEGKVVASDLFHEHALLFEHLLDRDGHRLLFHLFEPQSGLLILVLKFLALVARPLLDDAIHNLLILSVYSIGFFPLVEVVERPRRRDDARTELVVSAYRDILAFRNIQKAL